MITDPTVFADEPARELMHREPEVESLFRAWGPTLQGQAGDEVVIYGSSGVGKTSLARRAIERLDAEADIAYTYVQCLGAAPRTVLTNVLQAHPDGSLPSSEPALATLTEALRDVVDKPYLVVLDEAEGLPDSRALDRLADVTGLSTAVVVHDPHRWRSRLSSEAVSERYIDATDVPVEKFGVDELADILQARARAGLPSGVVSRSQLEWIADEVAGNTRRGIQALRAAAEHASNRGAWEIESGDIEACFEIADQRIRRLNLKSLTVHHHILYALIHAAGEISGVELHERYDAIAEDVYADSTLTPIVRRTRRDRLRKLEDYGLITREGNGSTEYRPVDSSIQPPVNIGELVNPG
ncbi:Cdc6/Cdc18 family protein [Halobellus rubicundus]|uniref:Cdc6/Cdc18 family protein n=1 Tax=Halobellus rubicundus TaxID=2996466 RepID=A0ABD5ML96_9EURY